MKEKKYYCRICGTEITKEQYEDHHELCEFCEDNEEMDEDEDRNCTTPLEECVINRSETI